MAADRLPSARHRESSPPRGREAGGKLVGCCSTRGPSSVPDNPDENVASNRLSHPTRSLAFEAQGRSNNLENVDQHHGVVVNYNTKAIASFFLLFFGGPHARSYITENKCLAGCGIPGLTHRPSVFLPGPFCERQFPFISRVQQLESSNCPLFRDFPCDSGL